MSDDKRGKIDIDGVISRLSSPSRARKSPQHQAAEKVFSRATLSLPVEGGARLPSVDNRHFPELSHPASGDRLPIDKIGVAADGNAAMMPDVVETLRHDVNNMSAAMHLMLEQISMLVKLQSEQVGVQKQEAELQKEQNLLQKQQIEAVARLAPIVVRSQDLISSGFRDAFNKMDDLRATRPFEQSVAGLESQLDKALYDVPIAVEPGSTDRLEVAPAVSGTPPKRGRGRPRTVQAPVADPSIVPLEPSATSLSTSDIRTAGAEAGEGQVVAKRGRGRPRKHPAVVAVAAQASAAAEANLPAATALGSQDEALPPPDCSVAIKRGRGRPRKNPVDPGQAGSSVPQLAAAAVGVSTVGSGALGQVDLEGKEWNQNILIYSVADKKDPDKFKTFVQIDVAAWDGSGLGAGDRFQAELNDLGLRIGLATAGGTKPRRLGAAIVQFQFSDLGNLNMKLARFASEKGGILVRGEIVG